MLIMLANPSLGTLLTHTLLPPAPRGAISRGRAWSPCSPLPWWGSLLSQPLEGCQLWTSASRRTRPGETGVCSNPALAPPLLLRARPPEKSNQFLGSETKDSSAKNTLFKEETIGKSEYKSLTQDPSGVLRGRAPLGRPGSSHRCCKVMLGLTQPSETCLSTLGSQLLLELLSLSCARHYPITDVEGDKQIFKPFGCISCEDFKDVFYYDIS